jgi:hypothetical protein
MQPTGGWIRYTGKMSHCRRGRRFSACLGLACLVLASVWPAALNAQTEMQIGVLAFRGKQDALERWSLTAKYLSQRIDDHSFKIVPLTLETALKSYL